MSVDRQIDDGDLLLQVQIDAVLLVDGVGLGGADVVADVGVAIEVGRIAPVAAGGLRERPGIRVRRRAVEREADAGQLAVGALKEAVAVVPEVEFRAANSSDAARLPRCRRLILQLRRDRIGRRAGVTVRILGSQAGVGPVRIHDDVGRRGSRRRIGPRAVGAEVQERVLVEVLDVVERVGAAQGQRSTGR